MIEILTHESGSNEIIDKINEIIELVNKIAEAEKID